MRLIRFALTVFLVWMAYRYFYEYIYLTTKRLIHLLSG